MHDYKVCSIAYLPKYMVEVFTLECPDCKHIFDIRTTHSDYTTHNDYTTQSILCPNCEVPYIKEIHQADCMDALVRRLEREEVYGI